MAKDLANVEAKAMATARTCVGCGGRDTPAALTRFVLAASGTVALDLHSIDGRGAPATGRGAHVHPRRSCLEGASKKGFSRSFRQAVPADAARLGYVIAQTVDAHAHRLLTRAARHRRLVPWAGLEGGISSPGDALREGEWLLVACDALAAAEETSQGVTAFVRQGKALAFGSRAAFSTWVGKPLVSCLILRDAQVASSVARACAVADGVRVGRVVEDG